ncbi:putative transcriptional regulator [Methanomicrobium sp. W14]|uniref:winged helix-turn-helix transcriptional regulator n=1 Tax=Methanomicrobium sp. W14 TaxID=2817839 RepID=UPI001AE8E098|nr:winged helix-turn-helix transcriptional regulator [Methanomicrobium sp. W14]MBP2133647.1 putative transcriptional regulator [Methanomicrobium sp. W14]
MFTRKTGKIAEISLCLALLVTAFCILPGNPSEGYTISYSSSLPSGGEPQDIVPVCWWEISLKYYLMFFAVTFFPAMTPALEIINSLCMFAALGFKRITEKDVLKNPSRKRIYDYICENPGSNFTDISRNTGINRGTLSYHVNILLGQNRITERKKYGFVFYFQNNEKYTPFEQDIFMLFKSRTSKRICRTIGSSNGVSASELSKKLGIAVSTVLWHLKRLSESGVVIPEKKDGKIVYSVSDEINSTPDHAGFFSDNEKCRNY